MPGRFRVVPVDSQDPRSVVAVTRAGLRRYLASAATTVDGIASAKVRVRRARVYATSSLRDTAGLAAQAGARGALLRGLNVFPSLLGAHHALIIDKATRHWVADQPWFWPTVAAVAVLVFLLALRWLAAQGQTRVLRRIAPAPDARRGTTYQLARTVTGALENDDLNATIRIRSLRPSR